VPDAVVVEGDEAEGITPAEVSAHTAAVAEGMTAVLEQNAAESAEEAKAAASVALEAAEQNAKVAEAVIEASAGAEAGAETAQAYSDVVLEALKAQTEAFNVLAEELKASRKAAAPPEAPKHSAPDVAPGGNGNSGATWTRR
jgi:hypothetical protein